MDEGSTASAYVSGFQCSPLYTKFGSAGRFRSMTEANEDVITTRFTLVPGFAEAERMDLIPLMAGMMSSFSLSVVLYVNGCVAVRGFPGCD